MIDCDMTRRLWYTKLIIYCIISYHTQDIKCAHQGSAANKTWKEFRVFRDRAEPLTLEVSNSSFNKRIHEAGLLPSNEKPGSLIFYLELALHIPNGTTSQHIFFPISLAHSKESPFRRFSAASLLLLPDAPTAYRHLQDPIKLYVWRSKSRYLRNLNASASDSFIIAFASSFPRRRPSSRPL